MSRYQLSVVKVEMLSLLWYNPKYINCLI
jgi:hypothetical protein